MRTLAPPSPHCAKSPTDSTIRTAIATYDHIIVIGTDTTPAPDPRAELRQLDFVCIYAYSVLMDSSTQHKADSQQQSAVCSCGCGKPMRAGTGFDMRASCARKIDASNNRLHDVAQSLIEYGEKLILPQRLPASKKRRWRHDLKKWEKITSKKS